jgi:hypothetical protein
MGWRYIRIKDSLIGTTTDAFLAPCACLRMIDTSMAMLEEDNFSKDLVRTCFHTFPAGLTPACGEFNILRLQVRVRSFGHRCSSPPQACHQVCSGLHTACERQAAVWALVGRLPRAPYSKISVMAWNNSASDSVLWTTSSSDKPYASGPRQLLTLDRSSLRRSGA